MNRILLCVATVLIVATASYGDAVVRNNTIRDSGKGVQKVGVKIGANVGEVVLKDNTIRAPKEVMDERK
jgi:hypothetical protein